jgi:signal transduction histidine kinase
MMSDQHRTAQTHLEKELAQRTRRLSALYSVLSAYHQIDDLDEMMKLTLNHVLNISMAHIGCIHLLDESGESFHLVAHQGIETPVLEKIQHTAAHDELLRKIIMRKKPLIITDMGEETPLAKFAQAGDWQIFVGVPIINGNTVWGVLAIYGGQTLQTSADEIELLEIIARQIGIAIENSFLQKQAERLAIVEERNRLARELHDSVTQSLYSLTLFAETAKRMMEVGEMAETRRCLNEIANSSQQALKEMRLLVHKLRPSTYKDVGLANSIEQRLRAVEGRSGIKFDFQADKNLSLNPEVEGALYAIAVEALNNALKHARADQVLVELTQDSETIYLKISDNGSGFELDQARQSGGLGLSSIQERVAELQGFIQIDTTPGAGTTIHVRIPD